MAVMCYKFMIVLLHSILHWYFANGSLTGIYTTNRGDLDCAQSASYYMTQGYYDYFRTFITPKSTVTFSLCASTPSNFNTALTLYDYNLDPALAIQINECDSLTSSNPECDDCGDTGSGFHEKWTLTLDQDFYYIEIYAHATGTYTLDIDCTADPTTANPTISPTTSEPTTVVPTTSEPTTAEPTTAVPTTSEPTTAPLTNQPTTLSPTTQNPTTNIPTASPTNTNNPSMMSITVSPTNSPTSGADGEAQNTNEQNTLHTNAPVINDTKSGMDVIIIVIIILGVIILTGAVGYYICYRKKKKAELQKQENIIEIENIVPSNGTTRTANITATGASNDAIMRVTTVSMSGDVTGTTGGIVTAGGLNQTYNLNEEEDTDNDDGIYGSEEEIIKNESPGSFEITPGSKVTKGNV
eukprot:303618_1